MKLTKITIDEGNAEDFRMTLELNPIELYRIEDALERSAIAAEDYRDCKAAVEHGEELRRISKQAARLYDNVGKATRDGILSSMVGEFTPSCEPLKI